jgi:hypothetical protein
VTVMSEPALYRLLTFHIPNLISVFLSLGRLSRSCLMLCKFFVSLMYFVYFQYFSTAVHNNILDTWTCEAGAMQVPFSLGLWNGVWWCIYEKYATFLKCKITTQQPCENFF